MLYLEIHGIKDGQQLFKCGTRYDWYLIEHIPKYKNTIIIDEHNKKHEINLNDFNWLPNSNIDIIQNLITNDENNKLKILNDFSYSRLNNKIVSINKTDIFKYPLIYLTPKT